MARKQAKKKLECFDIRKFLDTRKVGNARAPRVTGIRGAHEPQRKLDQNKSIKICKGQHSITEYFNKINTGVVHKSTNKVRENKSENLHLMEDNMGENLTHANKSSITPVSNNSFSSADQESVPRDNTTTDESMDER